MLPKHNGNNFTSLIILPKIDRFSNHWHANTCCFHCKTDFFLGRNIYKDPVFVVSLVSSTSFVSLFKDLIYLFSLSTCADELFNIYNNIFTGLFISK